MASFRHTAFAAIVCTSGPPCVPGKVSREGGFREDQAAARAAQRFMCGRGDDIRVRKGAGMDACGHQSRDVRHVHKENRVHAFGGFRHALEVDDPRIGARTSHNHFRPMFVGEPFDFVVIDALVFFPYPVGHEFVHPARKVQWMAVCQVAPVREIHAEHRVAWLEQGHVHGDVGRGP